MYRLLFLILASLLYSTNNATAHSVQIEKTEHPPVVTIKSFFSRNAPLVNAAVTIFTPDNQDPYQQGRTDRQGLFSFTPDRPGDWIFRVDDERGHIGRIVVSVDESFFDDGMDNLQPEEAEPEISESGYSDEPPAGENERSANQMPLLYRIVLGLSIIIGLTGFFYGYRAKKLLKQE